MTITPDDRARWQQVTGRKKRPRRSLTPEPAEPGWFTDPDLVVPQLFCWECRWHVLQPNMPTYWAGGRVLLCVFCAHLARRPDGLRPLHEMYEDFVSGTGPAVEPSARSALLLELGARPRASTTKSVGAPDSCKAA